MRPATLRILAVIVMLMVLSLTPNLVSAKTYDDDDGSLMVSIESADYRDLDEDQVEDDILIEFVIINPKANWRSGLGIIYCELELPSGRAFGCLIITFRTYSLLGITLAWYNTATEVGWYELDIRAYAYGLNAPGPGYDSMVFDPPTEGEPGSPTVEILAFNMTVY